MEAIPVICPHWLACSGTIVAVSALIMLYGSRGVLADHWPWLLPFAGAGAYSSDLHRTPE